MVLGPLSGYTVAITADRRSEEQRELLHRRGARTIHAPTIRTLPLGHDDGVLAATTALLAQPPDVVVLTTGVGVRGWLATADSLGLGDHLVDVLRGARVLARGPKAAGAAAAAGIDVHWRARSETGAEVLAHLTAGPLDGVRVAVQRDGAPQPFLAEALRRRGADAVDVPIYRWELPDDGRLVEQLLVRQVDAVTFTSSPAVSNLMALADGAGRADELRRVLNESVVSVCVGPVCAAALLAVGVTKPVVPTRARLGAMVQALVRRFDGSGRRLRLGGIDVVVQGAAFTIDGEELTLTDLERRLLGALAARPGTVVSKAALLERVWGDGDGDVHAVEVAVGRLRRRLGPAGAGLRSVPRRGYRLSPGGR